jgi:alanine-glyoxylate transaminase / serine-glyoxylate transaminase / serine-pyruvate transaminase
MSTPRPAGRHFLQIPGPTPVPDRILRAIDQQVIVAQRFKRSARRYFPGSRTFFKRANTSSSTPPPAPARGKQH